MPHRDALIAARERIAALERSLADAREQSGASTPSRAGLVERLEEEKRALEADRVRLVIERDRLVGELSLVKAALAKAEEGSASARRELKAALAIRDQLRRQAIEEAARAGHARGAPSISSAPSAPPAPAEISGRPPRPGTSPSRR